MNLENVPNEMRLYAQWCVWRLEDKEGATKPTKVPYSARTGKLCSVTDSATWATYEEAINACTSGNGYSGIGFILSENDPYCFIDLDYHEGDKQVWERQVKIFNEMPSYAERSPSGNGLHIIVRGSIPNGRRRGKVEIYSKERYMTMTGDVYRNAPITDCNDAVNILWHQMGHGNQAAIVYAGLAETKEADAVVLQRAISAANGDKFLALHEGRWGEHYPSQSEADFAYVDMIAFYTQNREQIQRIFWHSALGQREKAKRQDYVNYMLNRCFDRMLPPVDIDGLNNAWADAVAEAKAKQVNGKVTTELASLAPPVDTVNPYTAPPGLLGQIAQFIYEAAPRPVPEIALAGAIGLMCGIVGRSYNVSGTGLNQYVLLLAATGTGKEGIASGIDKLLAAVMKTVPAANEFIGPAEISSQQALVKHLGKGSASFVSIVGEFGLMLQQMSALHANSHLLGLRRIMLDLYNKSGEGKQLRPTIYSDREKNTATVTAPAFSLLGESTPERFYQALSESMISEGLLPRFTCIEYRGDRPALSENHLKAFPSVEVTERLATLCAHSLSLNAAHKVIQVKLDKTSLSILAKFDKQCDSSINNAEREITRQLWNRAHMKVLKLASLVAIGCNPYEPVIDEIAANWALGIVRADIQNLLVRFEEGEVGADNSEALQMKKTIAATKDYLTKPWSILETYKVGNARLHSERVIPYSYYHKRLANFVDFKGDKLGATNAIKRTLKTLVERGDLQEMSKADSFKNFKTSATCYMVAIPKTFGI